MTDKNWPEYLRRRVWALKSPAGGDVVVKLFPNECERIADRIEQLEALLRHARCPNKDCIDGAYPFGPDGELCECEWCDEREALLARES